MSSPDNSKTFLFCLCVYMTPDEKLRMQVFKTRTKEL